MKILQINTVYESKSTGRTCKEIEMFLHSKGIECCTAYGYGKKGSSFSYRINTNFEYKFHNFMSRFTGLEGYFSFFATLRLIKFIKKYSPDVIHLRNLHGHYLNLPLFFKFLSKANIPVIQNLHDCWAFTGKCAYYTTIGCEKWKNNCGKCPKKKQYPASWFFDFSKKMRRDKEKWYKKIKSLTVVGVSDWTAEQARSSFFASCSDIKRIYNWINMSVFHPYSELNEQTKEKYKIPKDKFIVLGVSVDWIPGTPRYEDFMQIASSVSDDTVVVLVGNMEKSNNQNIVHIPFVSNTNELALLYSCADAYIHCSVEDTFGKVIAEAMACGTPAIVYNITGCAELVKENCGYVVEPRNINQILQHIDNIKANGKSFYSNACVENVKYNFNFEKNAQDLLLLYEALSQKK